MTILSGGEVLTPGGWLRADVLIEGTDVIGVGEDITGSAPIDVTGCLIGPAFVDMHTHLREPGQTWKEDIDSASRAAVAGGFSAVVAMPNTEPAMDQPKIVEEVIDRGREVGLIDVVPSGALTVGRAGTSAADLAALYEAGVRLFTDDGDSVTDARVLEEIMQLLADMPGAIVAQHAEDPMLTRGGHMHMGDVSRRLGVKGLPDTAESEIVARDLELVALTGVRYHCQHVSSAKTVELIRRAKEDGLAVTAEVTPHHLSFDDTCLESLDTAFKMYPPLRGPDDREALLGAIADGTIDVVGTDHAPHSIAEKSVPFEDAPRGVIGLETAAAAVWSETTDRELLFRTMSESPAKILGLTEHGMRVEAGTRANITVFDPGAVWTPEEFASKSSNSPYRGRELSGRVVMTLHDGEFVYRIEEGAQ